MASLYIGCSYTLEFEQNSIWEREDTDRQIG